MTKDELQRPTFLTLFLENLADASRSGKMWRLFPWWIASFLVISTGVMWLISPKFYTDASVGIPIYAGILTLNGLLLTLAWNAFAKIFENICTPKFSAYLRKNNMFSVYLYQMSYVQSAQIIAVIASAAGLIGLAIEHSVAWFNQTMFVFVIASSVYALKEAVGAVTVLYDLIWYRSIFDAHQEDQAANIARFPPAGR